MSIPRSRSYLGIGKETRPSPGVAPSAVVASDFIPYDPGTLRVEDKIKYLDDSGVRGAMVDTYDLVASTIYSEVEWTMWAYPDTVPYAIAGVLGDVQFAAGTPNTHTLSTLNSQTTNGQPVTWSIYDYYGLGTASTRVVAGTQFESVDVKFAGDGPLQAAVKAKGYQTATVANPTPSFGTLPPLPAWTGTVTLNGSTNNQLMSGNCLIARPVTVIPNVDGFQRPYQLFAGAVKVTGQLELVFETDTELLLFLNNTRPALDLNFTTGAGAAQVQLKLHMSKVGIRTGVPDRGQDFVKLPLSYEALANTTDAGVSAGYSPIKVTVLNTKATGTYG